MCRRVISRAYIRKIKDGFSQWKYEYQKNKIIEDINTEGNIAVEAERSRRRVEILKKFLVDNGHSQLEIDTELEEKMIRQKNNMKSFIIKCFFKTSKFSVIPKAFNQLKAWTRTRKLYKQAFDTTYKYMNSDIFWAFKRWKHNHEDHRKRISHLTKAELIKKLVDDEHKLGSLQIQQNEKNEYINLQLEEREQLLMHFAAGQKIAFNRCEQKLKWLPLRKAFLKWQKNAFDSKLTETDEQIAKTQSVISQLMKICKEAEDKNRDLILENEELRQASLDGIEIAKAVQELTREREKLSHELSNKNLAIQQLLQDNNYMSQQLNEY